MEVKKRFEVRKRFSNKRKSDGKVRSADMFVQMRGIERKIKGII